MEVNDIIFTEKDQIDNINYPCHIDTCEASALRILMHREDANNIIFTEKDAQDVTYFINNIVHNINYPCDIEDIIFTEKDAQDVTYFINNIVHNINYPCDIEDIIFTEKDDIVHSDIGYITPRDKPTDKKMPKAPRKTYRIYYTNNTV
jgi:hypothetical protein